MQIVIFFRLLYAVVKLKYAAYSTERFVSNVIRVLGGEDQLTDEAAAEINVFRRQIDANNALATKYWKQMWS